METLAEDEITKHLEKYELIERNWESFWNRKSCLTKWMEFLEADEKWQDEF